MSSMSPKLIRLHRFIVDHNCSIFVSSYLAYFASSAVCSKIKDTTSIYQNAYLDHFDYTEPSDFAARFLLHLSRERELDRVEMQLDRDAALERHLLRKSGQLRKAKPTEDKPVVVDD